jgi:parvulin-like peptidyl-prolyl isomerase
MRKRLPMVAIAALLVVCSVGCGRQKSKVVARVNQRPITQRQLWEALEKQDDGEAGRRALDALIVRQLVRQESEKRGITVSADEIGTRLGWMKDYILARTGQDFDLWLEETGQTEEDVKSRISLQILTAKLVIPDQDREDYFEEHKEQLEELPHNNEAVIYRQIVVGSKAEAEAIRNELSEKPKEGEEGAVDFASTAEERSLDPMTRTRGGMVGWMVKGKSMEPELEKTLFSLKPGEISEALPVKAAVAEGEEGEGKTAPELWRIVKVEKYFPPHEITLEGNADVIEEWLLGDPQYQLALAQFFDSLRGQAAVEIVEPRYRALGEAYRKRRLTQEQQMGLSEGVPQAPPPGDSSAAAEGGEAEPGR